MRRADDEHRLCTGHAATPREQFAVQHPGDGLQGHHRHGEAGSLFAVAFSIGERSRMDCTEGAIGISSTGRMKGLSTPARSFILARFCGLTGASG